MPDPINPTGSPGQLPQVSQVAQTQQASSAPVSGATPEAGRGVSADKILQQTAPEAVSLEIAQKSIELQSSEEKAAVPSLEDATKTFREFLKNLPSDLQFKKDSETGIVMFKLINPVTKEVIREFPPEEVVEMTKKLRKMAQQNHKPGIIFDSDS